MIVVIVNRGDNCSSFNGVSDYRQKTFSNVTIVSRNMYSDECVIMNLDVYSDKS